MKKKIIIIKNYSHVEKDPRVINLLKIFENTNYEITYLGWHRSSILKSNSSIEQRKYKSILINLKAPFGDKSGIYLPLWWFFSLRYLLRLDWDIIHVINFSSLPPAFLAAKLRKKRIIYDIVETFEDNSPLPGYLKFLLFQIDRLLMKFIDAVILVDEMQIEEFRGGIPNPNTYVIYDTPELFTPSIKPSKKNGVFNMFYPGLLNKSRNLNIIPLMNAIKDIEGVAVTFAGVGDLVEIIKAKSRETPDKIRYLGYIPYRKVHELGFEADLHFQIRDPYPRHQKYICGSKFLQAMMCGKPILVNKDTSAAIKVIKNKCGLVVDAHNPEEIKEAILKLKNDKELSIKLGINSRKAYDEKYSMKIMRQRLLNIYSKMMQ